MLTKAPRGTRDILPAEAAKWQQIERLAAEACRIFAYEEIRTPTFEHTELFLRGVGETTDIVSKEMYTFLDRGERSLTLRPEGTAPVVRAFLEHRLDTGLLPVKLYYIGPMFRYDRPQAGRYRQFHQFGVEAFGAEDPMIDVEVMELCLYFLRSVGLDNFELHINSVGCPVCRQEYRTQLQQALAAKKDKLCRDCAARYDKNPLRILDCKHKLCREVTDEAPVMNDSLCTGCSEHFQSVLQGLDVLGETYKVNPRLVRGLDYYTRTAFEVISPALGAQSSLGGGGRFDNLLADLGGSNQPGIGFAVGLERVLLALEAADTDRVSAPGPAAFVAHVGEVPPSQVLKLVMQLREAGLAAEKDYAGRSLRAQLKYADKKGFRFLLVLGEEEYAKGLVAVKDMINGGQEDVKIANAAGYLSALLKEG